MKLKYKNCIVTVCISAICSLCLLSGSAYAAQGTEGDELQLLEAQQLEIQLGSDWAGTEFSLKTDSGMYPDKLAVGCDGVLRLEIGGSKSYVLSCMNSNQSILPKPKQKENQETENTHGPEKSIENSEKSISGIRAILIMGIIAGIAILTLIGHNRQKDNTKDDNKKE